LESQRLTLEGSVTLQPFRDSGVAVRATLSVTLSDADAQYTFSLQGDSNMADLTYLVPGSSVFDRAQVPFANSPLRSIQSSGVGFVLTQPITSIGSYELSSVFGALTFDESDWRSYLPQEFPAPISSSIRAEILFPNNARSVAVRVLVEFIANIAPGKDIQVGFVADPGASAEDYEFRASIGTAAGSQAATFREVLSAVGMGGALDSLSSYIPVIGDILDSVRLNQISAAVETDLDTDSLVFTEYLIDLSISDWSIISNVIELDYGRVYVNNCKDVWDCRVEAVFALGNDFMLDVTAQIPTTEELGRFITPETVICALLYCILPYSLSCCSLPSARFLHLEPLCSDTPSLFRSPLHLFPSSNVIRIP
jgi:hypothetical protein